MSYIFKLSKSGYGSVKELSIDNALMKEAVELDHSLRKLRSHERSFNNDIAHSHRRAQSLPGEITRAEIHCEKIAKDMDSRQPEAKGDSFSMVLNGKAFEKRQEAGDCLKEEATTLYLQAKASGKDIEKQIGSYSGFPLILRSTISDPFSNARLSACAPNFRYSAEIRPDSSPVGLCSSLHMQIYRGMDKMHLESKQTISSLAERLESYKAQSTGTFPKTEELKEKEVRYAEVMAALKKQNEEKPQQERNPHEIPWHTISEMSRESIRDCIKNFYAHVKLHPEDLKPNLLKSASDIADSVKLSHAVSLPPSVISAIDTGITSGKLRPDATYDLICASIDHVKKQGFSWKEGNTLPGIHAAFVKDTGKISTGDIIVKISSKGAETAYEALSIIDSSNSKYLGAEKSIEAIKSRVEQYVACITVRDKINETVSLSNSNNACKVQERRASYGLDI